MSSTNRFAPTACVPDAAARRGGRSILLALLAAVALAGAWARDSVAADFLDPALAFRLAPAPAGEKAIAFDFSIAPGYYLYREQFAFVAEGASLGEPVIPTGHTKFDETFQKSVEVYRESVRIIVPVQQAGRRFDVRVRYQGCADKGLCYPPQQRSVDVGLAGFGGDGHATLKAADALDIGSAAVERPGSSGDSRIDRALQGGRLWTVLAVFFVAGLLLSLTPCVLPMLPILSSIIVGYGASVSRGRGLALAASYALGMALVYTAFGVAAGLAGEGLSAALQKPAVLWSFAAALLLLSLSMFGFYELRLPAVLTGGLSTASNRLPAGRFLGVFAMGGVSALLVSPCVAAPLAGALVYLSQTRDVVLGGSALFALAAGMSVPLLLVGASAGALLPRTGAWMDDIKRFFGWLLTGVALYTVQSLLPAPAVLGAWALIAFGTAATLAFGARRPSGRVPGERRTAPWRWVSAALIGVVGVVEAFGASTGATDPLAPWAGWRRPAEASASTSLAFVRIRSVDDLDAAIRTSGRPVMLDFYADWCVSCKEMERYTFTDPAVRRRAAGALLLQADVTANNADDRALLKRFQLFGPPGTLFFDATGREISGARVIGFQNAGEFAQTLGRAGL